MTLRPNKEEERAKIYVKELELRLDIYIDKSLLPFL